MRIREILYVFCMFSCNSKLVKAILVSVPLLRGGIDRARFQDMVCPKNFSAYFIYVAVALLPCFEMFLEQKKPFRGQICIY